MILSVLHFYSTEIPSILNESKFFSLLVLKRWDDSIATSHSLRAIKGSPRITIFLMATSQYLVLSEALTNTISL